MDGDSVTSFRLLQSLFDDRMNRLDRGSSGTDKSNAETESVKTYILEWTEHTTVPAKLRAAFKELFSTPPAEAFKNLQVVFSDRDDLFQVIGRHRGKRLSTYVDYRDRRFLRLHSTTQSDVMDDLIHGWTSSFPELDHAWFDDKFLENCSTLGDFRGIGVEFTNEPLLATSGDDDSAEEKSDSIKLRQSGRAGDMLRLLRGSDTFSEQSSLSMVRVRYPRSTSSQHVTAEVRYDGRILGRGNSFVRHHEISDQIIHSYRQRVLEVEARFSMGARSVGRGYRLTGSPLRIDLLPTIGDLRLFSDRLFSAINPFRLAGMPRAVGPDHIVVSAVDLHTGQTLRFELRPDVIWVYLPAGTCGNTLLRFITNLQRHHSRLIAPTNL